MQNLRWCEWTLNDQVYPDKIFIVVNRQMFLLCVGIYLYFLKPEDMAVSLGITGVFGVILALASILWQEKLVKNRVWLDYALRFASSISQAVIIILLTVKIPEEKSKLPLAFLMFLPLTETGGMRGSILGVIFGISVASTTRLKTEEFFIIAIGIVTISFIAAYKTVSVLVNDNKKKDAQLASFKEYPIKVREVESLERPADMQPMTIQKGFLSHDEYQKKKPGILMRKKLSEKNLDDNKKQLFEMGDHLSFPSNSHLRRRF